MDAPAQTIGYMLAGYTVIFGAMIIYVTSLIIRTKRTKDELKMIKKDQKQ